MVVPWSLGSHVGVRVRRARRHARLAATRLHQLLAWSRVAGHLALLALSLPAAVLIEVLVGLIVLVGLLPLPAMRKVLVAAERLLARTLGDSFVLVSSPLQQAAIIAQVQRDVAWLSTRCRTVAVIAHSQGGAIAHRALRRQRPSNVGLLLTCGSGLRKLEEMEHMARVDDGLYGRVYLTAAAVALAGYAIYALLAGAPGALWAGAAGGGLFVFLVLSYLSRAHALDAAWFTRLLREPRLMWADYHATADPVSNGALEDYDVLTGEDAGAPAAASPSNGPLSVSICNERSWLRDHTTYWENAEEFVGPVAMWLTWLTRGPWHGAVARTRAQRAPDVVRRRWRVGALVLHRWVTRLAVAVIVAARWPAWLHVVRWSFAGVTAPLVKALPSEMQLLAPLAEGDLHAPPFEVWAATVGALVALVLVSRVSRMIWNRWTELDRRAYFALDSTQAASSMDVAQGALDLFSAEWWFFSTTALQAVIVTLVAPTLIGGVRPGVWTCASTVSVAGLVAATVYAVSSRRAIDNARTTAAAGDPSH